jgi:hypothetical protein
MPSREKGTRITRRSVISTATTAAAAGVLPGGALAVPAVTPSPARPTTVQVQNELNSSLWIAAKRQLISQGTFSWLECFRDDVSVDLIVYNTTNNLRAITPSYDPYQIESLISSVSTILDRCLVYRREMYDLEEQAVRRALEYQLFLDQYNAQLNIELAPRIETQRSIESQGQQQAYNNFSTESPPSGLSTGFASIAQASSRSAQEAVTGEQERKQNVQTKWEALKTFQNRLQHRHQTPGNPLNYCERYNRTKAFLVQDIGTAYQKIKCITVGIKKLFDLDFPLEDPFEYGYLDYLVSYIRKNVIENVEIATLNEVDFEHVVSIKQKRVLNPNGANIYQLVPNPVYDAAIAPSGNGLLSFSLANEFPAAVQRLRLKAVGVSIISENATDLGNRMRSVAVALFPPQTENLFLPGNFITRSPIIIEKVGIFDPNVTKLVSGSSFNNIDPRGDWKIQVSSNLIFPDINPHGRNPINVQEIKLHLKLTSILAHDTSAWSDLSW